MVLLLPNIDLWEGEGGGEEKEEEEEETLLGRLWRRACCPLACTLRTALWMYRKRSLTPTSLTLFPPPFMNVNVRIGVGFSCS